MTEFNEHNPYAVDVVQAEGLPAMRPSGVTPIGVIAILLCALGGMTGLFQLASPLLGNFTRGISQSIIDQAEADPDNPGLQMQAEMQKKSMAMQDKYSMANVVVGGIMTVACLAVVISAIMTMSGSAVGRGLFATMCLVILLADVGKAVMTIAQQREAMSVMGDSMGEVFKNPQMDDAEAQKAEEMLQVGMKVGKVVAMVFTIGWFLLKALFWIYSWRYLNRADVKAYYEPEPSGAF